MIIICDASALVALATCDCLDLLTKIYTDVFVTLEVFNEVTVDNKPYANELASFLKGKVITTSVNFVQQKKHLMLDSLSLDSLPLDMGELSAIALYYELNADYLLIDEKIGRKIAQQMNINIVGSLGILALAKQLGYIDQIKPYTDILLHSPIFISLNLVKIVLKQAGE